MEGIREKRLAAWMPSLTDAAFLMPVLFLFLRLEGAKLLLGDGDTGYHIRAGEWMLDHGRVVDRDIFSFTKAGEPWFAWEWLWDVAFAWLHRHWGMAAVVVVSTLVLALTAALLYRVSRRMCGNALVAITVTFLAVAASSIHWLARPHLFSWLFVVVFYWMLERAQEGRRRWLILLPVLTIPWVNLHGGFFVGIVLIGAYAAGELAACLLEPEREARQAALSRSRDYLLAAAGCLAASFINPYTSRLHAHILKYLGDSYAFDNVQEFLSLNFHHPVGRYLEVMVVLGVAAAAWNLSKRRFAYVILVAGWLHLALLSARNIPMFALMAAPPTALALRECLELLPEARVSGWLQRAARSLQEFGVSMSAADRLGRYPVTSLAAAGLLMVAFSFPGRSAKLRAEYDPERYPAKALAVLRQPECAGPIFTNDEWGDYLIYRLYPQTKVFVDGRSDFYGAKFGQNYLAVMNGKYDWEKTLEGYGVTTVLLPAAASLASTLKESPRWRIIYDDGMAIVFHSTVRSSAWTRAGCQEQTQASAAGGSGFIRDRLIAPHHREPPITKQPYVRRAPS